MIVKDLYMAKNLEELNNLAELPANLKTFEPKKLIQSATKILDEAKKCGNERDEEKEYYYNMRYIHAVTTALKKKASQKDQEHLKTLVGMKNLQIAMKRCEDLSEILKKRYDDKASKENSFSKTNGTSGVASEVTKSKSSSLSNGIVSGSAANLTNGLSPKLGNSVPTSTSTPTEMTVAELKNLIEQKCATILIIDCRAKSDFLSAHIDHPDCVSIPDEICAPGVTGNRVTCILKDKHQEAYLKWIRRTTYDHIVLYDWNSNYDTMKDPIKSLYDAMTQWDANEKYKSRPVILQNGIKAVYHAYPTHITQPQHLKDSCPSDVPTNPVKSMTSIVYPSWDEVVEPEKPTPAKLPVAVSALASSFEAFEKNLEKQKQIPKPVSVDRSTKPSTKSATSVQANEALTNGKDHKQEEIPSNILNNNNKNVQPIETLSNKLGKLSLATNHESDQKENIPGVPNDKVNGSLTNGNIGHIESQGEIKPSDVPVPSQSNEEAIKPLQIVNGYSRPEVPDASTKPQKFRNASTSSVPASQPIVNGATATTTVKLKDDSYESPRSGMLKRSSSNPNIASMPENTRFDDIRKQNLKPLCDRNLKPSPNRRDFHIVSSTERSETGLKNLGNTCYMNSIMQCLNHTMGLVQYFLQQSYRKDSRNRVARITEEFARAITEMNQGHRSISLMDLKTCFGNANKAFRNYDQQDSHEFLTFLLDNLHEELNRVDKQPFKEQKNDGIPDTVAAEGAWKQYMDSNNSIVTDIFAGQIKSSVTCCTCKKASTTFDTFLWLSIPLPDGYSRRNLNECLELYTAEEEISDWACASCKATGKARKKIDLWRLPRILIIHFQRFYNNPYSKKRMTEIDFPVDHLDLSRYVKSKALCPRHFQLYGVSNHYGTMESGHYTAYCRHNKNWSNFDDHVVNQVLSHSVTSPAAYILFYSFVDTP